VTVPVARPQPPPPGPPAPAAVHTGPPPFQQPTAPPKRGLAAIWLGAALAAVLVLAGVWYFALRDPGGGNRQTGDGGATTTRSAADVYGVATVTEDCPAAAVPDGQAQCVRGAECWSGYVMINGEINSIRKLPCEREHIWEVFAIALVPGDVADPYQDVLAAHPVVKKVCSEETLLASRHGAALDYGPERWEYEVLPPSTDEVSRELGVYRCVGRISELRASTGSMFGPR
jgi:hypothetical protein